MLSDVLEWWSGQPTWFRWANYIVWSWVVAAAIIGLVLGRYAKKPPCICGHDEPIHDHYRPGNDCGACGPKLCPEYRAKVTA